MDVRQLMDRYEEMLFRAELAESDYRLKRDGILTPEQRRQLEQLDEDYAAQMEEIQKSIKEAEIRLKEAVVVAGESVKGKRWHAVWSKPRIKWDTDGLVRWFKEHDLDMLDQFKIQNNPTVSIRLIKEKG
jgi:hypothetical protein